MEQLEAEAKDGRGSPPAGEEPPRRRAREHLPQWRRKRFLGLPERDSPSHSSPERGSDCSRNSSDHEDGSFAGRRTPVCILASCILYLESPTPSWHTLMVLFGLRRLSRREIPGLAWLLGHCAILPVPLARKEV